MQNLSRRGLHGTALEYAKLLLGLDPTDPRGVLFCIDYLAIRAGQYSFLKVQGSAPSCMTVFTLRPLKTHFVAVACTTNCVLFASGVA